MNNSKQKPKQAISIMADFGNGPYAWRKDATDKTRYVGVNIAESITGFPEEMQVSKSLEIQFFLWTCEFERDYDKESFDWIAFNKMGKLLTGDLADELGSSYKYYYHKPVEDPGCEIDSIIEVYPNT